jgi:hypothetical protein
MVNVPRQLITGSTPIDWNICGPGVSGPSGSTGAMNSFAAPMVVSGDPATAPASGRKVRPLINSLLFIDDRFMQVSLIAISPIF